MEENKNFKGDETKESPLGEEKQEEKAPAKTPLDKKKLIFIIAAVAVVAVIAIILAVVFLGGKGENEPEEEVYTEGLEFTLLYDGNYSVSVGTATNVSDIIIPENYNGGKVVAIAHDGFSYCENIKSIEIPSTITSINNSAFYGCTSLKYNEYENAKYLGNESNPYVALIDPEEYDITSCTIHPYTKVIGDFVFYNCTSLTSITIPDGVTTIGDSAFRGCTSLKNITIPDSVTSIGKSAFYGCTSLKYNEYENAKYLGNKRNPYVALIKIKKIKNQDITSCTIHPSTKTIGGLAFYNSTSLSNIKVDESNNTFKSIDGNLYSKDGKLLIKYATGKTDASFVIPDGVTRIGEHAFSDCTSLTSITIPDGVTTIGDYAFSDCPELTSITLPDDVTYIGREAFSYCFSLTYINIPTGVTTIGDSAFFGCSSMTSIIIPDSVTTIGYSAFIACTSLTDVYYTGSEEEWNAINFDELTKANIHFNYVP